MKDARQCGLTVHTSEAVIDAQRVEQYHNFLMVNIDMFLADDIIYDDEHDVIRALNNPSVLSGAQRHFGQQFIAHLLTLDWGFRFGGSVISVKMVVQIALAVMVTVTATAAVTAAAGASCSHVKPAVKTVNMVPGHPF